MKRLSPSLSPLPFVEDSVQNLLSSKTNPSCSRAGEREFLPNRSFPGDLGQARDFHTEALYPGPTAAWPQQSHGTRRPCPYCCHAARECPAACLLLCPSTSGAPAEISDSDVPVRVLAGGRVLLRTQPSLAPPWDPPFPF